MSENTENHEPAFSENHERVPTVDFYWEGIRQYFEPGERNWKSITEFLDDRFSNAMKEMIMRLVDDDPTVKELGRRIHRLAWALGVSKCRTKAELARKLGVSRAAISKRQVNTSKNGSTERKLARQSIFRP